MAEYSVGTYRAKHRRRGQSCYEYRIHDANGLLVAVCLTPANARRVLDALQFKCPREHVEREHRTRSQDRFFGDENNG